MLYIDTVNVNGTEYGVTTRGSEYPIACMLGTCNSGVVYIDDEVAEDAVFSAIDDEGPRAWMRTGQSGSYEYTFVILTERTAPEDYEYGQQNSE